MVATRCAGTPGTGARSQATAARRSRVRVVALSRMPPRTTTSTRQAKIVPCHSPGRLSGSGGQRDGPGTLKARIAATAASMISKGRMSRKRRAAGNRASRAPMSMNTDRRANPAGAA